MQALHPYMGIIYVLVKCQRRLPPVRGSLGLDVQSLAYLLDLLLKVKDMRGIKNGDQNHFGRDKNLVRYLSEHGNKKVDSSACIPHHVLTYILTPLSSTQS